MKKESQITRKEEELILLYWETPRLDEFSTSTTEGGTTPGTESNDSDPTNAFFS